ncbi:hypothetical protein K456DRAFT_729166 [Colletotrichum gloeosporioides 23]|nr:hypothetical protein K456DRAFT_729166 [Colletotrichum gloeosporioides 23]
MCRFAVCESHGPVLVGCNSNGKITGNMIGPRLLGRSHVDMGIGNAESQRGRSGDSWFRSALDGCSGQRVEYIGKPSQHLGLRRPISIQVQYGVVSRMPVVVEMPSGGVCLQTGNGRRASTPPGLPLCLSMISKVPTAGVNFGAEETASLTRRWVSIPIVGEIDQGVCRGFCDVQVESCACDGAYVEFAKCVLEEQQMNVVLGDGRVARRDFRAEMKAFDLMLLNGGG